MYIKDKDGEKIPLSDIEIFCKCPKCGKEIEKTADFWEYVSQVSDFDIDSAFYCESCSERFQNERTFINENISAALHKMDDNTIHSIIQAITATM